MSLTAPLQQVHRTRVLHRGRELDYYGGCDYFRLASHPAVLRALREGAARFGLNVAASRTTTGNHELFGRLERELARFFRRPRAALLSSGYAANLAFAQSVAGRFTHALLDERAHGSLADAAQLLGCPVRRFRHRETADVRRQWRALGRPARMLLMTDGLFAHDGSLARLNELLEVLPSRGLLLLDDAHGAGTLGRNGRGTPEIFGGRDARLVQTFSLSKAFGVYGGAVVGASGWIDALQNHSRLFMGNTPPPLPLVNAVLRSLEILRGDCAPRRRLGANVARVKDALRIAGLPVAANHSPIVGLVPESARVADRVSRALRRAGVFPPLIRYGKGAPHGFFRFALSSEHSAAQLDRLTRALIQAWPGRRHDASR